MTMTTGTRIGPYEITGAIGAGGMGEVYRARDTKLDRDVAIKILPDIFALDPDRRARFEREAKTLAALNHPNIAHIYGIEGHALVMELVEGEDLSAMIARGPVPIDEALAIARQIADALEAAHEQGIVHRDLKPANVKVRVDGAVKVLDFGLAKAMDLPDPSSANAMNSPTLTVRGTQMGVIVGTAAYMAPEQARGKAVDRRADIWAFGVVLYEMLTGRQAFKGDDISEVLATVLKDRTGLARAAARNASLDSPSAEALPREGSAPAAERHRRRSARARRHGGCGGGRHSALRGSAQTRDRRACRGRARRARDPGDRRSGPLLVRRAGIRRGVHDRHATSEHGAPRR